MHTLPWTRKSVQQQFSRSSRFSRCRRDQLLILTMRHPQSWKLRHRWHRNDTAVHSRMRKTVAPRVWALWRRYRRKWRGRRRNRRNRRNRRKRIRWCILSKGKRATLRKKSSVTVCSYAKRRESKRSLWVLNSTIFVAIKIRARGVWHWQR